MDYWFSINEIAKLAAQTEAEGAVFYEQLAKTAEDKTVSAICEFFGKQELEHKIKGLKAKKVSKKTSNCKLATVNLIKDSKTYGILQRRTTKLEKFFPRTRITPSRGSFY